MVDHPAKYGQLWSREELILAFDLYCRIPFQKTKATTPEVRELAALIERSPASVARKLGNFGSFDPELKKQGISGLPNTGALTEGVWNDFHQDWNGLVVDADDVRRRLSRERGTIEKDIVMLEGPSERIVTRKERLHQSFFRATIMSSYLETCCITRISLKECLIASHIVPWIARKDTRTDPTNGLCLSATFDRLFDTGMLTISVDYRIIVSRRVENSTSGPNRKWIASFHGKPIKRPQRFVPSQEHLEWHRNNTFKST